MLQIVISNKCTKDLKRAKTRGLALDEFFAVDDVSPVSEPVRVHLVNKRLVSD